MMDKLLWPLDKSSDQLKKYRIGVQRLLSIDENNRILGYMIDTDVEDGKNIHEVYRIVKDLASILMIHYTVNILQYTIHNTQYTIHNKTLDK